MIAAAIVFGSHLGRRLHGRPVGYGAIAIASFASWVGVPGPGEAVLITGAAFASRNRLDIVQVELYALAGALVGGMIGWAAGRRFGAELAVRPGPLFGLRRRGVAAGERFFARFGVLAVFFTPSWVAGIHRVPVVRYTIFNAISCVIWVAGYGLLTYFLGPDVADVFGDMGTWATLALAALVVTAGIVTFIRRRRARLGRTVEPD